MSQRLTRKEIKRDQVQEALVGVMEYLQENIRSLLLMGGVVLLAVGAVVAFASYQEGKEIQASEQLAKGIRISSAEISQTPDPSDATNPSFADVESRDAAARQQLELVIHDFGSSDAAAIARVYLGELAARSGDLDGARELWQTYLEKHGDSMLSAEVRVNLMSVDRAQGRGQELVTRIRAMLEETESDLPQDVLLYQLALTERELGLEEEARSTLQRLLDEHPQSIYAGEVRAELGPGAADNL